MDRLQPAACPPYILIAALYGVLLAGCASTPPPLADRSESLPPAAVETVSFPPALEPTPLPPSTATVSKVPEPVPAKTPENLSLEEFAELNDERLLQVYPGMTLKVVERIMDGVQSGPYPNPFRQLRLTGADGRKYIVLFYVTRPPRTGGRITENLLTPVILQDQRVVDIGRYPLKKLRRAVCEARGEPSCH